MAIREELWASCSPSQFVKRPSQGIPGLKSELELQCYQSGTNAKRGLDKLKVAQMLRPTHP